MAEVVAAPPMVAPLPVRRWRADDLIKGFFGQNLRNIRLYRRAGLQEKDGMPGRFPRHHVMRIGSDGDIPGEDYPTALAGQLLYPFHVRRLFVEAITQVDNFVFTTHKLVEATGQLCPRASYLSVQQTE